MPSAEQRHGMQAGCQTLGQRGRVFFLSEADYDALNEAAAPTLARGERFETELRMARRDGSSFLARLAARAVNPADTRAGTIWILSDVTALRAQEERARELLYHHTAIFENASAGIVFTRNRLCETCNPRLAAMFGYDGPQAEGEAVLKPLLEKLPAPRRRMPAVQSWS